MYYFKLTGFDIDNFRVFGKKTSFELAPITILTGTNSSGKSSFTKALNLLNVSYNKNGLRKLDLMESKLRMGGFDSIINTLEKREEISFCLEIEEEQSQENKKYKIDLVYSPKILKIIRVFDETGLLFARELELTEKDLIVVKKSFIKLPEAIINKDSINKLFDGLPEKDLNLIYASVFDFLQKNVESHNFKNDFNHTYDRENRDVLSDHYNTIIEGLENLGKINRQDKSFYDPDTHREITYQSNHIYSANPQFKEILPGPILEITSKSIQENYLFKYLNLELLRNETLFPVNLLEDIFNRLVFIDGVRATQEIVYTSENSPAFYQILEEFNEAKNPDLFFIEKWTVEKFKLLKIPDGKRFTDIFKIRQIAGYGYVLQIIKNDKNIGLTGLGYGVTQLLPILLKVCFNSEAIFVIEEPESNLHPALQSKLADFLVESIIPENIFFNQRQFIIETHSEYLIRKLQYLTAKGDIEKDQIQLYYFNDPNFIPEGEDQIKKININKDGSLTDNFGEGFFDEATSWKFELLKLNNPQKN